MLTFIGLGLSGEGISLKGVKKAEEADRIYAELYTSKIPEFNLQALEDRFGKTIHLLSRKHVEQDPSGILEAAKKGKTAFLVAGDPMVATTHVDLRLRAEEVGIKTRIVHGASIQTAAPGLAGLQSYKFGRSATLPLPEKPSETPYNVLEKNQEMGLHTFFLLDIESENERYLKANEGIDYLLGLEEDQGRNVFPRNRLTVVVARAGGSNTLVRADRAGNLVEEDFGEPPHSLIVPGDLHFMEVEALKAFANAPKESLEDHDKRRS